MGRPSEASLYGVEDASMTRPTLNFGAYPVRLYRPSSGTEGIGFMERWCANCERDKEWSEGKPFDECEDHERCELIANSYAYAVDDPEYHRQWVRAQNGDAWCLAYK